MGRSSRLVSSGVAAGAIALIAVAVGACNEHSVEMIQTDGAVEVIETHDVAASQQLDLLWTIDNSGSMCRSQEILREGIDDFIDELEDVNLDFHIAVTTTHMVEDHFFEPIAQPGHLQSTPQPLPGVAERACQFDLVTREDIEAGEVPDGAERGDIDHRGLDPVIDVLEAGIECTEDPDEWDHLLEEFDEEKFRCTENNLNPDCDDDGIPDDADYCTCPEDADDLSDYPNCIDCDEHLVEGDDGEMQEPRMESFFPDDDAYRDIPLVLRSEDYELDDGSLDIDQLRDDFSCMSMVGSRGDGTEQGLRGAKTALSPELTGGADEDLRELHDNPDQFRDEYPNAGFIRPDAETGIIFVSDENDCSLDPDEHESTQCGVSECTIQEHRREQGEDSWLVPVEELADDLITNVVESRGIDLEDYAEDEGDNQQEDSPELTDEDKIELARSHYTNTIYPASIHGAYQGLTQLEERIGEEIPLSCPDEQPEWYDDYFTRPGDHTWLVPPSCVDEIGVAWSGHRYEYFLREFDQFFPRPEEEAPDEPLDGHICGDFEPILSEIGQFFAPETAGCISEVYECSGPGAACPDDPVDGEPGECRPYPTFEEDDDDAIFYCDTGIEVRLDPGEHQTRQDLEATGYCLEDSFGDRGFERTCVVDPALYEWTACPTDREAMQLEWNDDDWVHILGDFEVIVRYANLSGEDGEPGEDDEPADDGDDQSDQQEQDEG